MKIIKLSRVFFMIIISAVFLSSCGTKNVLTKARNSGVKLEYSFPRSYLNYKHEQDIDQEIEALGRLVEIDIALNVDFDTKKNANVRNGTKIDIKLNDIAMSVNTSGQQTNSDISKLKGKEFQMVVSKQGKEVDTREADEIIFSTSPDEASSLGMIFNTSFPDLPETIVKIGDSWSSNDTLSYNDEKQFTMLVFSHSHTLNDFVVVGGVNCAEIKTKSEGTMKGKAFNQDMPLDIDGIIEGESTWYFDFVNGVLIEDISTGKADGDIIMDIGEMRLIRNYKNTTRLVK